MKVLVTGINGFVGQYLLRELESRSYDVWGIDTFSHGNRVFQADILEQERIVSIIRDVDPDFIVHLAAVSSVDHGNLSDIYRINFDGTVNLLASCKESGLKPCFLYVSSSQVYGNVSYDRLPVDESFPIAPVNHYGASKAAAEMAVKAFGAEYGLDCIIARPFNHTGPGQSDRFVIPKIINAFKRRDETIELGNVDTLRDFIDVRDIVKAYAGIIENFRGEEIYNIAGGTGFTVSDIFENIKRISGHSMSIVKKDFLVRKNEINSVIGNSDRLSKAIGWRPQIPIETTLKDMLDASV